MQAYAKMRADAPELVDIVASTIGGAFEPEEGGNRPAKRQRIYDDHKGMAAITDGIKTGKYHQVLAYSIMASAAHEQRRCFNAVHIYFLLHMQS